MSLLSISSHIFPLLYFSLYVSFVISYFLNTYFQCLSPAGEYNLRLGIIKELHPDMVATYSGRLWFNISFTRYFSYLNLLLYETSISLS